VLSRTELKRLLCVSFNAVWLYLSSAMSTLAWLYELSETASRNVLDGSVRRCGAVDLSDDRRHFPFDIWYMYYSARKLCDFCAGYLHMHADTDRKSSSVKDVRTTARPGTISILADSLEIDGCTMEHRSSIAHGPTKLLDIRNWIHSTQSIER
jgi:hypothetical protein